MQALTLVKPEPEREGDFDALADKPAGKNNRKLLENRFILNPQTKTWKSHRQSYWCACVFCPAVTVSSYGNEWLSPSPPSGSDGPGWT